MAGLLLIGILRFVLFRHSAHLLYLENVFDFFLIISDRLQAVRSL